MTAIRPTTSDPRLATFGEHWRARRYFEAHEAFEEFWLEYGEDDRDYYQGLIQAAVALHHAANGNLDGARGVAASSRRRMERFGPRHRGVDVATFLDALDRAIAGGPPPEIP